MFLFYRQQQNDILLNYYQGGFPVPSNMSSCPGKCLVMEKTTKKIQTPKKSFREERRKEILESIPKAYLRFIITKFIKHIS